MKSFFAFLLLDLGILVVFFLGMLSIKTDIIPEPEIEIEIIEPEPVQVTGEITQFFVANEEGEEDRYIYVVSYEFDSMEDAETFKNFVENKE